MVACQVRLGVGAGDWNVRELQVCMAFYFFCRCRKGEVVIIYIYFFLCVFVCV